MTGNQGRNMYSFLRKDRHVKHVSLATNVMRKHKVKCNKHNKEDKSHRFADLQNNKE